MFRPSGGCDRCLVLLGGVGLQWVVGQLGVATGASSSGVRWSCDDVLVKEFVRNSCGIRMKTVGLF